MLEMMTAVQHTLIPPGQAEYTTPGTYSWVVPANVTLLSAVCIGGGSAAAWQGSSFYSGQGGALRWINSIPVTPGETLTVVVSAVPTVTSAYTTSNFIGVPGGSTTLKRGSTVLLQAQGGLGYGSGATPPVSINGSGGNGGAIYSLATTTNAVGGSGAGGYYGNGASGPNGTAATDTSAGASGATNTYAQYRSGNNGGGASLYGSNVTGTKYGGGAGITQNTGSGLGSYQNTPGKGACRLMWGSGRSYPTAAVSV